MLVNASCKPRGKRVWRLKKERKKTEEEEKKNLLIGAARELSVRVSSPHVKAWARFSVKWNPGINQHYFPKKGNWGVKEIFTLPLLFIAMLFTKARKSTWVSINR